MKKKDFRGIINKEFALHCQLPFFMHLPGAD